MTARTPDPTLAQTDAPEATCAVSVNGEAMDLAAGAGILDVLRALAIEPDARGIAVAVDGRVVSRGAWAETAVAPGSRIEVIHAIGGG